MDILSKKSEKAINKQFDKGFRAGYAAMRIHKNADMVREIARKAYDWDNSYINGFITAGDASEEHATHGVLLALDRGLLFNGRWAKLIRWSKGE